MIIVLANYLAAREGKLDSLGSILGRVPAGRSAAVLVMLQPDLGTSLVFGAILAGMLFMSGREPALAGRPRGRRSSRWSRSPGPTSCATTRSSG